MLSLTSKPNINSILDYGMNNLHVTSVSVLNPTASPPIIIAIETTQRIPARDAKQNIMLAMGTMVESLAGKPMWNINLSKSLGLFIASQLGFL